MLRKKLSCGWQLITHPDHARLAGRFAQSWGNDLFLRPKPYEDVLEAVFCHDDGWQERDTHPQITRHGLPSAFSQELVGKYSAFEEIDLADYLKVRRQALEKMSQRNPYAAVLISMHTSNLLSARADRSTIQPKDLPLLDAFLEEQLAHQVQLRQQLQHSGHYASEEISDAAWQRNFRFLQACDNLSLLTCVDYQGESNLLHPLPTTQGEEILIKVYRRDSHLFALEPFPFIGVELCVSVPYRLIEVETFSSSAEFQQLYTTAPIQHELIRMISA